jgi:hypothetical protein
MQDNPVSQLIENRCRELSLNTNDFLRALGYKNISKGRRRLQEWVQGTKLKNIKHVEKALCETLIIEPATLQDAMATTYAQIRHARDAEYARTFVPHAVFNTSYSRPTQIIACALTGGPKKWLVMEFEKDTNPVTFVAQVLRQLPEGIPFFGHVLGFWINYTPSNCVEFDLTGQTIAKFGYVKQVGVTCVGGLEKALP